MKPHSSSPSHAHAVSTLRCSNQSHIMLQFEAKFGVACSPEKANWHNSGREGETERSLEEQGPQGYVLWHPTALGRHPHLSTRSQGPGGSLFIVTLLSPVASSLGRGGGSCRSQIPFLPLVASTLRHSLGVQAVNPLPPITDSLWCQAHSTHQLCAALT